MKSHVSGDPQESGLAHIWAAMAELEAMVDSVPDLSDEDRAEGYAFVAGLYKWGIDRVFLASDAGRPRFVRFTDTISQWGLGNPDNLYLVAEISEDGEYLVRGDRGSCATFVIEVRTGIGRREDNVHSRTLCFIEAEQLELQPDGGFELSIGGVAGGAGNHLPLPPGATTILVRATYADWPAETLGPLSIEALGPPRPPVPRMSSKAMTTRLTRVGDVILALGRFNDRTARDWRGKVPVNAFPAPGTDVTLAAFPGQRSSTAQFSLRDADEALVVTMDQAPCRYLGFSIGHLHWYTNLDYHNRQCSLNSVQARLSSDGRYRYVICAKDPGVPNWIDTGGRLQGFMFFRCQGLLADSLPHPETVITTTSRIREILPADEPQIGLGERLEILRQRRLAVQRRHAY